MYQITVYWLLDSCLYVQPFMASYFFVVILSPALQAGERKDN